MNDFEDHLPQPYKGSFYRKADGFFMPTSDRLLSVVDLIKREQLKKIEINTLYFKDSDLSFLRDLNFVEAINIVKDGVDLTPINDVINLKDITIQRIKGKQKGYIDFGNFPKLEQCFTEWEIDGAETIFGSSTIKKLTIDGLERFELTEFGAMSTLAVLSLRQASIISLNGVQNLANLQELELISCKDLQSLDALKDLRTLNSLRIESCKKIEVYDPVSSLAGLTYLNLSNQGKIANLDFVNSLHKLQEFAFTEDTTIVDGNLECLSILVKKYKLKKAVFKNRIHYSHKREQLGYEISPYLKSVFGK